MKDLILAIQFLTRIPINIEIKTKESSFADSTLWFPAVGLLIGAINALVYWLTAKLLPGMLPIVFAVLANVCVTGALHVDGLADTCDGIFSARKKDKMLEIMKDSRIGTNGALAVIFDMLFRIAILASLPSEQVFWLILSAPAASRALLPLLMKLSVYARAEGGLGGLFLGKQGWGRTIAALFAGIAVIWALAGVIGVAASTGALAAVILFRGYIYSKLQGMTGDTLGAANELAECVFLLLAAVIWRLLL